jgi:hypothetical protein
LKEIWVVHLFVKALGKAGVQFPASKTEIIKKLGDTRLRLSETNIVEAKTLVENIVPDFFENGSAFFCAFHSALYEQGAKKAFLQHRNRGDAE